MAANIKEFLLEAKKAYYEGNPIISDSTYDTLEERYPGLTGVGYNVDDGIPHYHRLYSLDKKYKGEDLNLGNQPLSWVITPKLDGASVAALYFKGKLISGLTRGDGKLGKDIMQNIKHLIPLNIPYWGKYEFVQFRGEVVAPKYIKNARNYAAGALQLKDEVEFGQRNLEFILHEVYPYIHNTYIEDIHFFTRIFNTILDNSLTNGFDTDGEVYRLNNNADYYKAGFTAKHPKGAFALKERSEGIETTLLDVIWQTGKSGKVTPVAILEPVIVEDATVSRATLNNVGFIEALDLKIGDKVLIERAGGIIPRIMSKAV